MRYSSGGGDWEGISVVLEVKAEARSERTPLGGEACTCCLKPTLGIISYCSCGVEKRREEGQAFGGPLRGQEDGEEAAVKSG